MKVQIVRATVKPDRVADAEAAARKMFASLHQVQPHGIRYASTLLPDGVTFLALLDVEDGVENPLPTLPAAQEFQAALKDMWAAPPTIESATVVGSYRLFE